MKKKSRSWTWLIFLVFYFLFGLLVFASVRESSEYETSQFSSFEQGVFKEAIIIWPWYLFLFIGNYSYIFGTLLAIIVPVFLLYALYSFSKKLNGFFQ